MKNLLLKSWLMLCLLVFGVGTSWGAIETGTYTLCTSTSDLVAGAHYIIASGTSGSVNCISNVDNANNRKIVSATVTDSKIEVASNSTIMTLTLGGSTGAWTFSTDNYAGTNGYLASAASGNNNHCRVISTSTTSTISFSSNAAVITIQPHTSRNILRFNSTSSCFACYSTGQAAVYLYKKETAADTRTAVNMTGFTATSTTLVKGGNTTTTVTNDQNSWTPSYTYESSNTSVATVSNAGVITAVAKGTARITATLDIANDDANWKKGATASKTIDITVNNPSHTAHFSINGTIDPANDANVEEGSAITFPANPEVSDVVFKGWATAAIVGTQDDAPSFVNTATATMSTNDVTYYAVFAVADGEETTESFGWEEATTPSNWTIGGTITRTEANASYSANSGSYYGLTNSNSSVQYKNKVKVKSFSYNCVRRTTNTNTSIKIETSTNGTSWTEALSTTWNTFNSDGKTYKKIEKTWDEPIECYVRVNLVTAANRQLDDISITYGDITYSDYCTTVSLDPKPTIVLSATELAEYAGNTNTSITASVSEGAYTGALTVESSADAVATASISEGTITINALTAGTATITVTAPEVTGFRKNTATIAVTVSEKLAHGLAFSADVLNLTVGDTEFSEPTLDNPNSLPVVYSLVYATPGNVGKVATIDPATGKITLADPSLSTETQGAVTVKASTVGDNSHAAGEVTYNLVVARKVTTTSWSNGGAAVEIDQDEIATLPTASNDGERNLFYESSNTDVATIDNTGAVTFVAYGTTTITVKTTATAEYAATSATYELTFAPRYTVTFKVYGQDDVVLREETTGAGVTAPAVDPIGGKVFRGWAEDEIDGTTDVAPAFVSTTSLDGDKTLFAVFANVSEGEDFELVENLANIKDGEAYIGSYINYSGSRYYIATSATDMVNATVTDKVLTIPANALQVNFVSTGTANEFYIKNEDGDYLNVTLSDWASFTSTACALTFSGSSPFVLKTSTGNNYLRAYGSSTTAGKLKRYASQTNTGICVFQKSKEYSDYCTTVATSVGITIGQYGYATFVAPSALDFSESEVTAYAVEPKLSENKVTLTSVEQVPAGKAIVVKAPQGDYNIPIINSAEDFETALEVSATATPYDDEYTYYYLGVVAGQVGFRPLAEGGSIKAGKCFFKVAMSSGAPMLTFSFDDDETGITSVESAAKNGQAFNLAGQRVNANAKGIIIVNGKKFFNK